MSFVTLNPLLLFFIILFCHFSTAIKDPLKELMPKKTSNSFCLFVCLFVFSMEGSVSRAAKDNGGRLREALGCFRFIYFGLKACMTGHGKENVALALSA